MTQALAEVRYSPNELDTEQLGAVLVKSGFFQDTRDIAQAIVKVLAGRELGFGPIASMQGVYIVKGRVTLSANLVGAAIQRSGKYRYTVKELTNDRCTLVFSSTNIGGGTFESTFTIQDAQQAGIAGDTYKKFPRNMLFSRALTNGARWYCPEVFNGPIYTPDELGAQVDDGGRVLEISGGAVQDDEPSVPTRERDVDDAPRPKRARPRAELVDRYAALVSEAHDKGVDLDPEEWALSYNASSDDIKQKGSALRALIDARAEATEAF